MVLILLLASTSYLFSQPPTYDIIPYVDNQTTLDFGQIANLKNASAISGQQEFFSVDIIKPDTQSVRVYGSLDWTDVDGTSYSKMAEFITEPFNYTHVTNQQLGSMVKIADSRSNSSAIDRNIAKGKLVGEYTLTFCMYKSSASRTIGGLNSADRLTANVTRSFKITNPTQTITIVEPMTGDVKFVTDNISIGWTEVEGVTGYGYNGNNKSPYYRIKANKILAGETPDDALNKNNLYVDKKLDNKSGQTTVSWQLVKSKDWVAGDNIAVVVSAVFPGDLELKSAPITFTVKDNSTSDTSHAGNQFVLQDHPINMAIIAALNNLPPNIMGNIPSSFVQNLTNGNLILSGITLDGVSYSPEQMQVLMNHLIANPSLILSIVLNRK